MMIKVQNDSGIRIEQGGEDGWGGGEGGWEGEGKVEGKGIGDGEIKGGRGEKLYTKKKQYGVETI